jgi:cytochrome c5
LAQVPERLTAIAFAIVITLSAPVLAAAEDGAPSELERQGVALAERMCSACHAIGKTGASPHAHLRSANSAIAWTSTILRTGCAKA